MLSFCKVRILHYAAAKPVHSLWILERLRSHRCSIDAASLNRFLLRMDRNGWLKTKRPLGSAGRTRPNYSLTPKGREALNLARERLKKLVTP